MSGERHELQRLVLTAETEISKVTNWVEFTRHYALKPMPERLSHRMEMLSRACFWLSDQLSGLEMV
jgi:hypothetical protein